LSVSVLCLAWPHTPRSVLSLVYFTLFDFIYRCEAIDCGPCMPSYEGGCKWTSPLKIILSLFCFIPRITGRAGIATGYWQDDRGFGVRVPMGARIFTSAHRPDQLWDPPTLLSSGYWVLFPQGQSDQGVKLTTHFQLVPKTRKRRSMHPFPLTS
jgi:hypothetical protein